MDMENKRREWVKTAAIIFLTIMLLLTFFSNTIMNYSLPEVSAKYVETNGTLSEQIRGTVNVESAQQYEVKHTGSSRVVNSVEVKQGDTVEKGQVILRFDGEESPDLDQAELDLETKQNELRTALLAAGNDYSSQELDIKDLEEDIERLKYSLTGDGDYIKAAESLKKLTDKVTELTAKDKELTDDITHIDEQLTALTSDNYDALDNKYSSVLSPLYDEVTENKAKKEEYDKQVEQLTKELGDLVTSEQIIEQQNLISKLRNQLEAYNQQLIEAMMGNGDVSLSSIQKNIADTQADLSSANAKLSEMYQKQTIGNLASLRLKTATNNQNTFTNKFMKAENALNEKKIDVSKEMNKQKKELKTKSEENKTSLDRATADKEKADAEVKTITDIETKERDLERKKLDLKKKQEDDLIEAGKTNISIESMQNAIKRAEEKIEKIKSAASDGEITAQVAGVISSINIVPGETLETGASVASIEMTEKGYTASFTVTIDQAKKVTVGDYADIQYFYGGDVKARLTAIKPDSSNPQNKKLMFEITGDVLPGQSLQLVMGGKGQKYEYIIPNNAIKEDSNGKFVLTVTAKSSPLGNRYIAKRTDITVLASDGVNTAVTGVVQGDYIISTSTKPINPGDQVRIVDN